MRGSCLQKFYILSDFKTTTRLLIENPGLDLRHPRGREGRMCGLKYSGIFQTTHPPLPPLLVSICERDPGVYWVAAGAGTQADIHSIIGRTISVLLGPEPGRLGT